MEHGGVFMQTTGVSKDLSLAMDCLEDLLNNNDGEIVIETIKNYKKMKSSSTIESINFKID